MKKILKYFFLLLSTSVTAQNLVPNPSFEDTVACPYSANQMNYALDWHASKESPDYFNQCNSGTVGVPSNFCGFQYPHLGNAYAGIITYSISAPNAREYFTCQLINNLNVGSQYIVSMHVNWSGSLSRTIASNKIGMLFSTVNYDIFNNAPTGTILFKNDQNIEILLLDIFGRKILSDKIRNESKAEIDISSLPRGSYFLKLLGEQTITKKIIKL